MGGFKYGDGVRLWQLAYTADGMGVGVLSDLLQRIRPFLPWTDGFLSSQLYSIASGTRLFVCVWSLVFIYGICRLLFSLLALVECWVVLSCWISDALLIIFSLSVSVWWSVGVGPFVSFHFRLVKGVTLRLTANYARFERKFKG